MISGDTYNYLRQFLKLTVAKLKEFFHMHLA
jgi:hypothetical protein